MKKYIIILIGLCLLFCAAGCQGDAASNTGSPSENEAPQSAEPNGDMVDKETFSVLVPKGWEVMDVDGGVQIYKMSGEVFEVHFRGSNMNDTEAQQQAESTAKQYEGTQPELVELLGKQFWTTTFTAGGVKQVTNLCIEEGVMISVKYGGPNYETNPDFEAILDSITFKQ